MIYLTLFASAFLAATIVPFYSEIAVVGAVAAGHPAFWVWLAASVGNTLGAVVNAIIGRLLPRQKLQRLLRLSDEQLSKAERWFQKYGQWSLLLAWLPVGGDALTVVAGIMRVRWLALTVLIFIGKSARYAVVIWLTQQGAAL